MHYSYEIDVPNTLIAILTLFTSGLTFWWIALRKKRVLYLVPAHRKLTYHISVLEFALINAGNEDVLITDAVCGFGRKEDNARSFARQSVDSRSDSFLLPAGKAIHCKIQHSAESEFRDILKQGEPDDGNPACHSKNAMLEISWLDATGAAHSREVQFAQYSLYDDGGIAFRPSLKEKYDLYALSK